VIGLHETMWGITQQLARGDGTRARVGVGCGIAGWSTQADAACVGSGSTASAPTEPSCVTRDLERGEIITITGHRLTVLSTISRGTDSAVYEALDAATGRRVAVGCVLHDQPEWFGLDDAAVLPTEWAEFADVPIKVCEQVDGTAAGPPTFDASERPILNALALHLQLLVMVNVRP